MKAYGKAALGVAMVAMVAYSSQAVTVRVYIAAAVSGLQHELSREGLVLPYVNAAPVPRSPAQTRARPTSAGVKASGRALVRRVPTSKASPYTFEVVNSEGRPASWDTCATIPVVGDMRHAPAGMLSELRAALAQVNAATGLSFALTATVDRALTVHDSDNPTVPIVVGFASGLSGVFSDANMAGLTSTETDTQANTITGATIAFNTDLLGTYTGDSGPVPLRPLILHELGHVAGLDHTRVLPRTTRASLDPGTWGARSRR